MPASDVQGLLQQPDIADEVSSCGGQGVTRQGQPWGNPKGPSMLAYLNPAFSPSFVSRIPKPAPLQAPLQELSSISQMQPAQQHRALHAEQLSAVPANRAAPLPGQQHIMQAQPDRLPACAVPESSAPLLGHAKLPHSAQLFGQPGHDAVSVVCQDDAPSSQHGGSGGHQLQLLRGAASDPDFGEICRRLVAIIEVGCCCCLACIRCNGRCLALTLVQINAQEDLQ